jgi:hypothetical protein
MPKTAVLHGRAFNCPECGAPNEVIYSGCTECDIEVELVDAPQKNASKPNSSHEDELAWLVELQNTAIKFGNDISLKWLYNAINDRIKKIK